MSQQITVGIGLSDVYSNYNSIQGKYFRCCHLLSLRGKVVSPWCGGEDVAVAVRGAVTDGGNDCCCLYHATNSSIRIGHAPTSSSMSNGTFERQCEEVQ